MTDLAELKLFATHPHKCGYLHGQESTTVFVDPNVQMDGTLYNALSDYGFRRSGLHVYRPHCESCHACIPIRVPVKEFKYSKSQRRCRNQNQDLEISILDTIDTDEHYALYQQYIHQRHHDGDMFPPDRDQFRDFLCSAWGITRFIEFREEGKLIAVSVIDQLERGLSALYFFFDDTHSKRSLGVFNILHQIAWAKELGLPYLYLGYWIRDCQKMSYKVDYRPFELFIDNTWVLVADYPKPTK